jgi:hypothetical protein
MRPVEPFHEWEEGWGVQENGGRGKFNYDTFDIL